MISGFLILSVTLHTGLSCNIRNIQYFPTFVTIALPCTHTHTHTHTQTHKHTMTLAFDDIECFVFKQTNKSVCGESRWRSGYTDLLPPSMPITGSGQDGDWLG